MSEGMSLASNATLLRHLFCVVLASASALVPAQAAESNLAERPKQELFTVISLNKLPKWTKEVADQLEISPQLDELNKRDISPERKAILREKILETILESYFDAA